MNDQAHLLEHSIEVQLPFIQTLLNDVELIPLVVGQSNATDVVQVLESIWQADDLILVSTDLSHFLFDADARRVDSQTIQKITHFDSRLEGDQACGHFPLNGALQFAHKKDWQISELKHCNSGEVTGNRDRVVGYASFALSQVEVA